MPALVLGGVSFQDFEIPESVKLGGNQAGKLWKLPGGVRIFDAQGPDDDTIEWSGRFRTASAMGRALAIDGMRRAGQPIQLSVLGLSYFVIIRTFSFHPARAGFEIVYEIGLIVLTDNTQGFAAVASATIDSLVTADIAAGAAFLT